MWKEGGDRLLFGQYDDSAAGPNLDAEVMPVEHPHTYERDGVGGVGLYVSRLVVPEHGNAILRKGYTNSC